MSLRTVLSVGLVACVALSGCSKKQPDNSGVSSDVPHIVTADIQAGIEKHIEDHARQGGGHFKFSSGDKDYAFKLVKVHTEYLANLGPRRHFACVDLVDTAGDVYDVDFFLSGDPGSMTVTETTLHKLNGKPFYAWEQKKNGTWARVPADSASQELLGVVSGRDEFEFRYQATLPVIKKTARIWLPFPTTDAYQDVEAKIVKAPGTRRFLDEREHGNKVLLLELGPADSKKVIDIRYQVKRREKAAYEADAADSAKYLKPDRLVPIDEDFRSLAQKAIEGKTTALTKARALYDHVMDRMKYAKFGKGWGKGDAVFACDAKRGNCTDFHAYFMALARAVGIPARFAIGAAIPSSRNDGGVDGYHCWVEFYADGKWWPVDISEADKYSSLSTYYFGHHPANRIEFSRGRDLVVDPGPKSGPINFLAYPVLEVDDEQVKAPVRFSFSREGEKKRS